MSSIQGARSSSDFPALWFCLDLGGLTECVQIRGGPSARALSARPTAPCPTARPTRAERPPADGTRTSDGPAADEGWNRRPTTMDVASGPVSAPRGVSAPRIEARDEKQGDGMAGVAANSRPPRERSTRRALALEPLEAAAARACRDTHDALPPARPNARARPRAPPHHAYTRLQRDSETCSPPEGY